MSSPDGFDGEGGDGSPTTTSSPITATAKDVFSKVKHIFRPSSSSSTAAAPATKPVRLPTAPPGACIAGCPDIFNGLTGRPCGLPPKSEKEAAYHAKQIAGLNAAAKKKAVKEVEQERSAAKLVLEWEAEVFPNWEAMKGTRKTRKMWREGVPPKVRAELWRRAIGNELQITQDLYNILRQRGEAARQSLQRTLSPSAEDGSLEARDYDALTSIDIDLPRTFPSFQFFKEGPLAESLTGILEAYVQYRPDVGYVQGMSYIVAMMLLHMEPENVFVSLANLLHQSHLLSFFRVVPLEIGGHLRLYDLVFEDAVPSLHAHFSAIHLLPQCYVFDWFMTIFSKSLPINIACRIWDLFLLHPSWLYRAAVGLLLHFQRDLAGQSFDKCFHLLTHLPKDLHESNVMLDILSIKLDEKKFASMQKKAFAMDNSIFIPP